MNMSKESVTSCNCQHCSELRNEFGLDFDKLRNVWSQHGKTGKPLLAAYRDLLRKKHLHKYHKNCFCAAKIKCDNVKKITDELTCNKNKNATKQEKSFQSFTQYLEITPTHSIKAKTSDKSLEPNPNAPCTKKSPMNRVKRLFSIETREIIVGDKSKPTKKKPVVEIFNNSQQYKGSTTDPQTFFDEDKETQKNTDSLEERSILKKSPRALDTARREKIRQFIKDNLNRQQQKYNYDEKNRKERNRLQTACSELKRFKNEIKNNSLVPTGDNSHQQKMKQMKNENLNTAVTGLHYEYSNGKKYIFQTSSFDILDVLSQDECIEIRKIKKNPKPITNEKCVKNVSYEINKRGEHLMKNLNPNKQDILTKCIEEKECPRRESTCENKVNESKLRRSKKKVMYFIRKNLF